MQNTGNWYFRFSTDSGGKLSFYSYQNQSSGQDFTITNTRFTNTDKIYHVVIQRNAADLMTYIVDGVMLGQSSNVSRDLDDGASNGLTVGRLPQGNGNNAAYNWYNGHISDLRIYKGIDKYDLTGKSTGDSVFIPASANPDILPDTPSGVSGKSKLTKITEGAVSFDGNGDYLSLASTSDFDFGTDDFTCELFFRCTDYSNTPYFFDFRTTGGVESGAYAIYVQSTGEAVFWYNGSNRVISNNKITLNSWVHLAVVRSSGTTKMYIDGVAQTSSYSDSNDYGHGGSPLFIGVRRDSGSALANQSWNGQLSNVRVLRGTALYTSNFAPPTRELTNVTNTKLLCCQSNTEAGSAAVAPNVSGSINTGTQWSKYLTGGGGFQANYPATNAFNGTVTGANTSRSTDSQVTQTFTPPGAGINYSSKVEVWTWYTGNVSLNGGSNVAVADEQDWTTMATGSGTINNIRFIANSGNNVYIAGIRVDNTILLDPLSPNGDAAPTNFNPFTDDINATRGQETSYATFNPLDLATDLTLFEGNLKVYNGSTNQWRTIRSSIGAKTGKYYCEFTADHRGQDPNKLGFGAGPIKESRESYSGYITGSYTFYVKNGFYTIGAYLQNTGDWNATYNFTDTYGVALDLDNSKISFYVNGKLLGGEPQDMVNRLDEDYYFYACLYGTETVYANFGQKPFKFPPPDGFQSLNLSSVRPEKVIAHPDQYVSPTLWTGNHPTGQSISNLDLSPDLVWIKDRSGTNWHYIFDTIRGPLNAVFSNAQNQAANYANTLTSFDSNGFTLGSDNACNNSGSDYVAWCWKAGGSKGVFNVDDVGYANASDVNMNVGGLNSSVYDQSQNWTNNVSSTSNITSGHEARLFNGILSGSNADIQSNQGTSGVINFTSAITGSKIEIYTIGNVGQIGINGSNLSVTANQWVDTGVTSLTSVETRHPGAGSIQNPTGLKVDGKILVDSGLSVTNVPTIAPTGCSVGTKQGFSIVKWAGDGSDANRTVPHGLLEAPSFIIVKAR